MLTVTADQLDALGGASRARMLDRLEAHCRARFARWAEAHPDAAAARAWVIAALADAERRGFSRVQDARRYVEFAALYGRGFAEGGEGAWAAPALARRDLAPAVRLDLLDVAERAARPAEAAWPRSPANP